ncbi:MULTISPECIES: NlpC/P60 family protein [unclassified Streptomyces]|uniref:C40 family peptidase n=1 Tax=unclassified Streptomyces TaxID=2593676 RepID=UPI0033D730AB
MSERSLRTVCTAAAVAAALVSAVPTAQAAPTPPQSPVTGLLTQLRTLYRQAEEASEAYNAAEEQLKARAADEKKVAAGLTRARTELARSREAAGRLAREQYQGRSDLSTYMRLLLARDPQGALDQDHLMRRATDGRRVALARLARTEKQADALAREARKALDEQAALAARQRRARDEVRARLNDVEGLLASLSEEQLAELAALEREGTAKAQRDLLATGALSGVRAPSPEGEEAVRYAVGQVGKPYVWGAEGPGSYDCSGLTSQAWAHAGRTIPRTSQEQWASLPRVPLRALRPGDLVVYYPGATHVALYVGDGMVVQAPRPGTRVKVSPIASNPLLGAVRPDPGVGGVRGYRPLRVVVGEGSDEGYGEGDAPAEE